MIRLDLSKVGTGDLTTEVEGFDIVDFHLSWSWVMEHIDARA